MTESPHGITNVILWELFPVVCPLATYLEEHLATKPELVRDKEDTEEFKHLVRSTLVGIDPNRTPQVAFPPELVLNESMDLKEVIDEALEVITPTRRVGVTNVFSGGHVKPWNPNDPIQEIYPNPSVEYIRSPPWSTLLKRIGKDIMLHLLTSTSLFKALANNSFLQITGPPIQDMYQVKGGITFRKVLQATLTKKRPASALDQVPTSNSTAPIPSNLRESTDVQRPQKRRKIESKKRKRLHKENGNKKRKRPNKEVENKEPSKVEKKKRKDLLPNITTTRSRLYFYRQAHTDNSILRGALVSHPETSPSALIFNAKASKGESSKGESSKSSSKVDDLMKYIFPKQYPSQPPDRKIHHPWRLRKFRGLMEDMLDLNSKCQYMILLRNYCPIEAIDKKRKTPEEYRNIRLDDLPEGGSSHEEVTNYVHAVVKKVIPLEMFGSTENRATILRAMTRFIRLRKYENISLQYMIHGFKHSDCEWLKDSRLGQSQHRVRHTPPTACEKQLEISNQFVFWLFNGFLITLLRASFYVTDTSHERNKISYYRHDLWKLLTAPAIETLKANMFRRMDQREVMKCNRMYASLRLLPKKSGGVRPIINLSRKSPKLVNGSSVWRMLTINKQLEGSHLVLSCELEPQSFATSSSSPGMTELYGRIKAVREKLVDLSSPNLPKLFMVKVDIQKSFDSIKQDKVLEVMKEALEDVMYISYAPMSNYTMKKGTKVFISNGKVIAKPLSKAVRSDSGKTFMEIAEQQAESSYRAIFIDKIQCQEVKGNEVIDMVESHITGNIIQLGKHFYRQFTGIPQGSALSPALCRLYYNDMEDNLLADLTKCDDSALLRLADDFLFVSKNKNHAISFLERMSGGLSEYNCTINKDKTITNFPYVLSDGTTVETREDGEFPYCGLLLHMRTLEIRTDYSRYHDGEIRNTLTVARTRRGKKSIILKMKSGMQFSCKMMFSDTSYNSRSRVMLNVYQILYFSAMKLHAYLQELHLDPATAHLIYPSALPSMVEEIFDACYGLLKNGSRSAVGLKVGARFDFAKRHLFWLGASAFCLALPQITFYEPLRAHLQEKILVPGNRNSKYLKRALMSTVHDERNKIMDGIRYQLTSALTDLRKPKEVQENQKPKSTEQPEILEIQEE